MIFDKAENLKNYFTEEPMLQKAQEFIENSIPKSLPTALMK